MLLPATAVVRLPTVQSWQPGKTPAFCTHNTNNAAIEEGDLVLIDAGCEYEYYASDITRTFPASGKFSNEQKAIYEIVLKAQETAIEEIKPGALWDAPHNASVKVITQGLIKLGLLQGKLSQLVKSEAYKAFYMHRVGHWIGMDVCRRWRLRNRRNLARAGGRHGDHNRAGNLYCP